MQRTRLVLAAIMLASLAAGAAQAGGRATVTVIKAPKDAVAGQAVEVAFVVKPEYPMSRDRSIEPTVKATCGDRVLTFAAVPQKGATGQYKAAFTRPAEGEWVITVDSRFCETKMKPLTLKAAPAKPSQT
jgi:uncharacterized protein (DUF2141 family)